MKTSTPKKFNNKKFQKARSAYFGIPKTKDSKIRPGKGNPFKRKRSKGMQ